MNKQLIRKLSKKAQAETTYVEEEDCVSWWDNEGWKQQDYDLALTRVVLEEVEAIAAKYYRELQRDDRLILLNLNERIWNHFKGVKQ